MNTLKIETLKRGLNDPLMHFLIGGAVIFLLVSLISGNNGIEDDPRTIHIDRKQLLSYLQFKTKIFEPEMAERQLEQLSPESLERLTQQYIREEVLYREANSLGFGDNDYIIKKRMIQKMDFIIDGVATATFEVTDKDIQTHYETNIDSYVEPGFITFTHVFVSAAEKSQEQVNTTAHELLSRLTREAAEFTHAPRYGDRFAFGVNYVERGYDVIASHFGNTMADILFNLTPDNTRWQGPYSSPHGQHLVMLVKKVEDRQMTLSEVRNDVTMDLENQKRAQQRLKAIDSLVASYKIINEYPSAQPNSGNTSDGE